MRAAVVAATSRTSGGSRSPSICGFPVGVAVHRALKDPRGGRDLGFGRLQDRLPARAGPGGERRAEVGVAGVVGRDRLAVPVGELAGEDPVPGGQLADPLIDPAGRLVGGEGEFVALSDGYSTPFCFLVAIGLLIAFVGTADFLGDCS